MMRDTTILTMLYFLVLSLSCSNSSPRILPSVEKTKISHEGCTILYRGININDLKDSVLISPDSLAYRAATDQLLKFKNDRGISEILYHILRDKEDVLALRIDEVNQRAKFGAFDRNEDIPCFDNEVYSILRTHLELGIDAIQGIKLISGKKGDFGEYPLVECSMQNTNCTPEFIKHPKNMRLSVESESYYCLDAEVANIVGIHRYNDTVTLVIPLLFREIYFADVHYKISVPPCD